MDERPTKRRGPIGWSIVLARLLRQSPVLALVTLIFLAALALKVFSEFLAANIRMR